MDIQHKCFICTCPKNYILLWAFHILSTTYVYTLQFFNPFFVSRAVYSELNLSFLVSDVSYLNAVRLIEGCLKKDSDYVVIT